jgi:hypothetical protein
MLETARVVAGRAEATMGGVRKSGMVTLVLLGGCLSPWHCDKERHVDLGAPVSYDFSVGELGRPLGTACTDLDQCNRDRSDRCAGTCRCGDEGPCTSGACCDGRCVDLFHDPANCGGCGVACPSGECGLTDTGVPHCTCDVDGGIACSGNDGGDEPSCSAAAGLCSCQGRLDGACAPARADRCTAAGCGCGDGPACSAYADHCDPAAGGCRCGSAPACDPKLATSCVPTELASPCRCAHGDACTGDTFCCTQNSTCCRPSQFCCLNGCCDQPCLLFGFCDK